MLTPDEIEPTEGEGLSRSKLVKYMDRFNKWSKKLNDEDLTMVAAFCINVQKAWRSGQEEAATPAEAVQMGLPGLGSDELDDHSRFKIFEKPS